MRHLRSRPIQIALTLVTIALAVSSAIVVRQRIQAGTAALVNGERLSVGPTDKRIEQMKVSDPARFRGAERRPLEEQVRKSLINARVELRLISQVARGSGVIVSQPEIDRELKSRSASYESEEAFNAAMAGHGYSQRDLRNEVRDLLAKLKMRVKLAQEVTVSEIEISSYIANNRARLEAPQEQIDLTQVNVINSEAAAVNKSTEPLGLRAKKLGLKSKRFWQQEGLLDDKLSSLLSVGGIVDPIPEPDNSLSIYEVHERRIRKSGEKELRLQVQKKILRSKQSASFGEWLRSIKHAADVQVF